MGIIRQALRLGWPLVVLGATLGLAAHGCSDDETGTGGSTATGGTGGTGGSGGSGATGGEAGGDVTHDCAPPTDIPDPWDMVIDSGDAETETPLEGLLVEIQDGSDAVVASGSADASGQVPLSVPTGGMPIDGTLVATHDGFLPQRLRTQNGLGWGVPRSAWLWSESFATEMVQTHWDATWDQSTAMVAIEVRECNVNAPTEHGIYGATVSLSSPGAGAVYLDKRADLYPELTHTTAFGTAVFANVPAGPSEITVHLRDREVRYEATFQAGSFETLIVYPRADAAVCAPEDASTFEPDWKPSGGLYQGLCTDQQLTDYHEACRGPTPNEQACTDWEADVGNQDCLDCAISFDEAPIWNGIVAFRHLGLGRIGMGQCVSAFEGDLSDDSCGAWIHAAETCTLESCQYSCPTLSSSWDADFEAFLECEQAARAGDCATYGAVADACWLQLTAPGAAAELCNGHPDEDFWEWGFRVAGYLCGPDPGGAGGGGAGGAAGGGAMGGGGAGGAGGN